MFQKLSIIVLSFFMIFGIETIIYGQDFTYINTDNIDNTTIATTYLKLERDLYHGQQIEQKPHKVR